jgi:hypothetical protein
MLEKLDASVFDWSYWRSGDVWNDFHIPCRSNALIDNKDTLRKYAIGWCYGENLICRPKEHNIAVMFQKDGKEFWFHLRDHEFESIFGKEYND